MMKSLKFLLLLFLMLIVTFPSITKAVGGDYFSNYKVVVDEIKVNGITLTKSDSVDIVISREDSIMFFYHCEALKGSKKPVLFKLTLRNSNQQSTPTPSNIKVALYTNLPEDFYDITISAFDPANEIVIQPALVKFRVDKREAKSRKELQALKLIASIQDSLLAKVTPKKQILGKYDRMSLILGLIFGTIVAVIVLIIVSFIKKSKSEGGKAMEKGSKMTSEHLDKVSIENSNLRAEIAALRGQIDALQHRGNELRKRNRELEEKSDKLSSRKEELEELQKQKDEIFAVIIHDIKNPVALIKSLVELLRSYDLTVTEQHEIIDDIFETTSRIVTLSQEVSKILALESSVTKLELEKVDIVEIIKDVSQRYNKAAANKGIEIFMELKEDLPFVEVDINKVDDVIDNLLNNAIKFTNMGGKIKIVNTVVDGNFVVEVSDNGVGLSEDDVRLAFQRGARLSAKPTGSEHSSGLGLWIVKKLVEAHRGRVWIKSALGKGSTFAFSMPVKQVDTNFPIIT